MKKEEDFLEDFKRALISTIKSISQQKDCEIKFGTPDKITDKNISLPEIKRLESLSDIINVRAIADSEALRLKYSDKEIFELYRPKGKIAEKLYKIAEKVRYEKIGSDEFKGIKKNISTAFNIYKKKVDYKNDSNKNKKEVLIEKKFDTYLRSIFFDLEKNKKTPSELKKIKKEWDKNFKKDLNLLKINLKNQEAFNQIISKIISSINIEEEKNNEDDLSDKERFENIDNHQNQDRKDGKADKEKEEQELTATADLPETNDLSEKSSEEDKFEEVEDESGISKKQYRKIFSESKKKYKVYTNEFDEFIKAEELETNEELSRLRASLDQQL